MPHKFIFVPLGIYSVVIFSKVSYLVDGRRLLMNILVVENPSLSIDEVQIHCKEENEKVRDIVNFVSTEYSYFTGKGSSLININPMDIYYIQTTDKKTFLYTIDDMYEISEKLYQLEEKLSKSHFFRISKDTVVNLMHIKSVHPQLNRNLLVVLKSGEKLIMSRRYVSEFRSKLTK